MIHGKINKSIYYTPILLHIYNLNFLSLSLSCSPKNKYFLRHWHWKKFAKCLEHFILRKLRVARKGKKMNSRVPRIISARFLKPTKKKGWLGERKKDEVARYAVSSVVRRSLEVTWGLPRWIVQATRGRAEVPVWWNGSRVIEILCSLPSRYDVRRGPHSYRFFLSLSLLAFSPSLSYAPPPSPASLSLSLPLSPPPNPPVTHSLEKISGPVHVSRPWNANASR